MILRPFLYEPTACASYLLGCTGTGRLAVVDPHVELVDSYVAEARRIGAPIVAVLETHVQADHVSGLPALVAATGATAYLPEGAGVDFEHHALADGGAHRPRQHGRHDALDPRARPRARRLPGGRSPTRHRRALDGLHRRLAAGG
jgi:glyoxylase-like metal-dependent hydrolase (beta-lactamase superfamily II)